MRLERQPASPHSGTENSATLIDQQEHDHIADTEDTGYWTPRGRRATRAACRLFSG